jgi:uncharacterized protein
VDLRRKLALLDGSGLRAASVSASTFALGSHLPGRPDAAVLPNPVRMPVAGMPGVESILARAPRADQIPFQPAGPDSGAAWIDRLRRGLAALDSRAPAREGPSRPAPSGSFPAERRETADGVLHVRELLFDSSHRHGRAPVGTALEAEAATVAALALDPSLGNVDPRAMLLLDTETTGLSGGTGTLPFVVGLGWFEDGRLRLMQLLLRRPGEERPILAAVAERMARASCVVTYNGKTFDWPLLRGRYVMNRLRSPEPRPHVDLLHCARRVFRHRIGGARLIELEEELLGHIRSGDIPGEEIPERYFRYLRGGDGSLLRPVLEHNAQDVVLLAALLGLMTREFSTASAGDPRTHLGYASVAERAGDARRALEFARAAASSEDRFIRAEALVLAARVSRREGDDRSAAELLERAVLVGSGELLSRIHLELAKLYEHRLADLRSALHHARHTSLCEGAEHHRRRVERLERRVARIADVSRHLPCGRECRQDDRRSESGTRRRKIADTVLPSGQRRWEPPLEDT